MADLLSVMAAVGFGEDLTNAEARVLADEIVRLREWIDTVGRTCPSYTTVDAALGEGADG